MTKISHKGLWIDFSSLEKSQKKLFIKSTFFAFLGGFIVGFVNDPIIQEKFPLAIYFNLLAVILFVFTGYYWHQFYQTQDELFKKHHDYGLAGGFLGFFVFGGIVEILSNFKLLAGHNLEFFDFVGCSIIGMIIAQYYFYRKYLK